MKRYYNNVNVNTVLVGERTLRTSHDGLVNEVLLTSGIKYTYELDEVKYDSSHIDRTVLPTNKVNQIALKSYAGTLPVLARVVGLYKRSYKIKKNRKKRRIVVKGRLVSVGTSLGIVMRKGLFPRGKKMLRSRRDRKHAMWREIGKLYRVRPYRRIKAGIVYKAVPSYPTVKPVIVK